LSQLISPQKVAAERALVLVVDDEYGPRESVAFALSTEFTVDTAGRAMEALTKIKQREFASIVLDIRMPEMDGIRALEEIRKIDPLVSVIMLTGYGTKDLAIRALRAKAGNFIEKPFDIEKMRAAIEAELLGKRGSGEVGGMDGDDKIKHAKRFVEINCFKTGVVAKCHTKVTINKGAINKISFRYISIRKVTIVERARVEFNFR